MIVRNQFTSNLQNFWDFTKCKTNFVSLLLSSGDRESNCFMVPSKAEAKLVERIQTRKEPIQVTESDENSTVAYEETNGNSNIQTASNETTNGTSNDSHTNGIQNKQNEETNK